MRCSCAPAPSLPAVRDFGPVRPYLPVARSGRPLRSLFRREARESVGLCGKAIETPELIDPIKGQVYRCETVNRGPWCCSRATWNGTAISTSVISSRAMTTTITIGGCSSAEGRRPLYVPLSLYAPLALGAVAPSPNRPEPGRVQSAHG